MTEIDVPCISSTITREPAAGSLPIMEGFAAVSARVAALCRSDARLESYTDAFGYATIELWLADRRAGYATLAERPDGTRWEYVVVYNGGKWYGTLLASAVFARFLESGAPHLLWAATEETLGFHAELVRRFAPVFEAAGLVLARDGRNYSLMGFDPLRAAARRPCSVRGG